MKTNAFVRQLASNKRAVRENALSTLKKFLSSKEKAKKLDTNELNKLWKGLFYTMWFCDRPRPQQRLANELAKLFSESIVDEQFYKFVESFWTIMIKEWRDLDKWRTDKFLMLMRYVIRECFTRIKNNDWDEKMLTLYLDVLTKVILKDDSQTPRAITYHIIDVWVDEIENVIFGEQADEEEEEKNDEVDEESDQENDENLEEKHSKKIKERKELLENQEIPIDALLAPMKELCGKGHFEALVKKIRMEVLNDERLAELDIDTTLPEDSTKEEVADEENDVEEHEEEEWKGFGN
jgi:ribosomal RNA-processing protein 1